MKSLLVVAAHPDDEVLGAGGLMSRWSGYGHTVSVQIVCENHVRHGRSYHEARNEMSKAHAILGVKHSIFEGLPDQGLDSVKFTDIVSRIENAVVSTKPSLVVSHMAAPFDMNRDHQVVAEAVRIATRPHRVQCDLWEFQTLTNAVPYQPMQPNMWVGLKDKHVQAKIDAMLQYVAEQQGTPSSRSPEFIETWLRTQGMVINEEFAEPFRTVRQVLI